MTSVKCFQCGFVSARGNETCKRCGGSLTTASGKARKKAGPKRTKVLAICIATAIIALILGLWLTSSVSATRNPSPSEVAALLYSDDAVKSPLTTAFPTELTEELLSGDLREDNLLRDYLEGQVLKQLGLVTVDFTVVKADKRKCWRYDIEAARPMPLPEGGYGYLGGSPGVVVPNPNGAYEQCDEVWNYDTTIKLKDPATVDRAALSEKLSSLADISYPPPLRDRPFARRGGVARSTSIPIGSVEIAEVSDVVLGNRQGVYTVGFKFRFKPNGFGELLDLSSPIFKLMPAGIRQLFKYKIFDDTEPDKRLIYTSYGSGSDGLTFGHAELMTEGSFNRQWKIVHVYFDSMDQTKYTFHRVE